MEGPNSDGRDARRPQDTRRHHAPGQLRHIDNPVDYGRTTPARAYGVTPSRVHPSDRELQCARVGNAVGGDNECCSDQRITRRLDDGDDDEQYGSSASGDTGVPDDLTPEEIVAFKKARRKEQCRVNQANYRKRKRAFEQQMDREIGALKEEIRALTATRNQVRSQSRARPQRATSPPDPIQAVNDFYQQLGRAVETASNTRGLHAGQIDTIAGLQYETFDGFEELFDQWQGYASSFEVFELELMSVRGTRIGESIIVSAQAELSISMHSRAQAHRLGLRSSPVVNCSVVQRFVFDDSHQDLAAIVSEVDWIPALADSRASPISQIRSAAELVRDSSPLARFDTA